ncbi:MAG TPA: hypothetical protein VN517_14190 [Terriglobales bacterium]|nr:hypothetical protein [Terriglobales bacterium]
MKNPILSTVLMTFAIVASAYGKGPVDLILISGGGLNQPIEITDPASLNAFNPWIGQFADWKAKPLVDAPCYRRSFEVMFYLKSAGRMPSSRDRGDLQMIYATRYCWTGEAGYVYLPGPGEPLYGPNGGTIIRADADGKWHPATPAWDSLLSSAVTMREQEATVDKIVISGGELKHPVEITDSELLSKFDPWTGIFVDWKVPARMGSCNWEYEVTYFKRGTGFDKKSKPATRDDQPGFRLIYGLRYCMGNAGEPGYVHLAGYTDKFWEQNVHIVWDGTQAGEWHPSTPVWKDFIRREVDGQVRSASVGDHK